MAVSSMFNKEQSAWSLP